MAAKSANLYARIEPDVKEQVESILSALGIPASNSQGSGIFQHKDSKAFLGVWIKCSYGVCFGLCNCISLSSDFL